VGDTCTQVNSAYIYTLSEVNLLGSKTILWTIYTSVDHALNFTLLVFDLVERFLKIDNSKRRN